MARLSILDTDDDQRPDGELCFLCEELAATKTSGGKGFCSKCCNASRAFTEQQNKYDVEASGRDSDCPGGLISSHYANMQSDNPVHWRKSASRFIRNEDRPSARKALRLDFEA